MFVLNAYFKIKIKICRDFTLKTQIFTQKYRSWLIFYSEFLRKNLAGGVSAFATRIALFPCYCFRYFRCWLFHCCSCSSSSSNFRGLTRARAGPTSLPPDFGEWSSLLTHSCALPAKYTWVRLFQNCAFQVVLAGIGQRHFKSLQHNLAKLSGFSRRNCEFPTISKKSNCFSLWTSPWCFLLFQP